MRTYYYEPTSDPIFKYLMSDDDVRNGFLGVVIGEEIKFSKLLDHSLNPLSAYNELRSLINKSSVVELMQKLESVEEKNLNFPKDLKNQTLVKEILSFVRELSPRYYELMSMIPHVERQTQLDVVCETPTGYINVEIQIQPQNYWDIRILDHVCGLFHRQFGKGFKWSALEDDIYAAHKVKRAIGVSLFWEAPKHPEAVQNILPWYTSIAWGEDELQRHFQLLDQKNPHKKRPGIEFFDFHLKAFHHLQEKNNLKDCPKALVEWLDFWASAQNKKETDILKSNISEQVKKAYSMILNVPKNVQDTYEENLIRQQNISHFVQATREEGIKEGIKEGMKEGMKEVAKKMKAQKKSIKEIEELTELSEEEINLL